MPAQKSNSWNMCQLKIMISGLYELVATVAEKLFHQKVFQAAVILESRR